MADVRETFVGKRNQEVERAKTHSIRAWPNICPTKEPQADSQRRTSLIMTGYSHDGLCTSHEIDTKLLMSTME